MTSRSLLFATALIEAATGIALLVAPSLTAQLLLGSELPSPASLLVARVGGFALLSIGVACWLEKDRGARGLVAGLLVYNAGVAGLMLFAAFVEKMTGFGIWPVCAVHAVFMVWCVAVLRATGPSTR